MKHFLWLILILVAFSSCKKYKLSQPSYLNFGWKYANQSETDKAKITGVQFYLTDLTINGARKEGEAIEISQKGSDQMISFTGEGNLGINMDVPVGEYTAFNVAMNIPKNTPCLVLLGTVKKDTELIPMRIEWTEANSLVFSAIAEFELKKKKTYEIDLNLDVAKLFENVSSNQWLNAMTTNEDGVATYVIRSNNNISIFNDVDASLANAIYLTAP